MLLVDSRAGSQNLIAPLRKLGLTVEATRLEFGDIAFEGRGMGGKPVSIGIEHKTLSDICSSLRTDRFAGHQLQGLVPAYDYAWLLIEGPQQVDRSGQLVRRRRDAGEQRLGMHWSELQKRLLTIQYTGVYVKEVIYRWQTVRFLQSLYHGWTDKALDEHRSHIAVHKPLSLVPLSPFRQAVCAWPHIGVRTSLYVERAFAGKLILAANATVKEWATISASEKRRLGMSCATDIVRFLQGG